MGTVVILLGLILSVLLIIALLLTRLTYIVFFTQAVPETTAHGWPPRPVKRRVRTSHRTERNTP